MHGETKGPLHLASQQWMLRKGLSAAGWTCGDSSQSQEQYCMSHEYNVPSKNKTTTRTKIEAAFRQ